MTVNQEAHSKKNEKIRKFKPDPIQLKTISVKEKITFYKFVLKKDQMDF